MQESCAPPTYGSGPPSLSQSLLGLRRMNPFDQGRRQPKLAAKLGLTSGHLSIIGLMIESAEMKQAMQQQDTNLVAQVVSIGSGLTRGRLQRDSEIACVCLADLVRSWKAKHVGRLVLA